MNLWAISDLHLGYPRNRKALLHLTPKTDDWLIVAGDVGETLTHLEMAFRELTPRFARVIWVPGNHELWTPPSEPHLEGVAKYEALIDLCRSHGVVTPEDPFPLFENENVRFRIAPLFVLYDYSFRPGFVTRDDAIAWAAEAGTVAADERYLKASPHDSVIAWCDERIGITEKRLADAAGDGERLILVNHFPLRREHAWLPLIPRFRIWCGTDRTRDWPERYGADIVIYGHLHFRRSFTEAGVRYEEVSLGYPRQWDQKKGIDDFLRFIA